VSIPADDESLEALANQKAVMALILSICGFLLLPLIASVMAVLVAHTARRMSRGHPEFTASSVSLAAMIFGYIGLAYGLGALVYVFG
jgi:hypothetical protein